MLFIHRSVVLIAARSRRQSQGMARETRNFTRAVSLG